MYGYALDHKWVNLNNETNSDGDRLPPRRACNVRTPNGMVIGRVVHIDSAFVGERFRAGEYVEVGHFDNVEAAAQAVAGNQADLKCRTTVRRSPNACSVAGLIISQEDVDELRQLGVSHVIDCQNEHNEPSSGFAKSFALLVTPRLPVVAAPWFCHPHAARCQRRLRLSLGPGRRRRAAETAGMVRARRRLRPRRAGPSRLQRAVPLRGRRE